MREGDFGSGRVVYALAAIAVVFAIGFALVGRAPKISATPAVKRELTARYDQFAAADDVTAAVHDRSRELVRVEIASEDDRANVSRAGRIVQDLGSFALVSVKKGGRELDSAGIAAQKIDTSISLPGRKFDPLAETEPISQKPDGFAGGRRYFIVQFAGNATDEWLDSVRDAGGEVLQYVPNQAFFVYADDDAAARIAAHSRVRWIGEYMAQDRIPEVLRGQIANMAARAKLSRSVSPISMTRAGAAMFDVAVFARADLNEAANAVLATTGGRIERLIDLPNNFFDVIRIELPIDSVESLASIPDVVRIDAWSKPTAEDERAAQIVSGNYLNTTTLSAPGYDPLSQFGVNGLGVTISMVDDGVSIPGGGGFYLTTTNTVNGPLRGGPTGATGGHGHLNASIISGASPFGSLDPLNYNYGMGVAPSSNIINIPFLTSGYTGVEADTYNDTVTTVGPNGVLGSISNNSWGNDTNGNAYDSYTAQFDGFALDASAVVSIDPLLMVFSAGNSGPGVLSLTRPKAAKNLIAVGNSENLRTEFGGTNANNIDDLRGSSSRGPTADGRIKPDIVAPGSYITGSRAGDCSSVTNCFDANHAYSIGTSHAAPQVAGAAALFTQWWKNGHGGQNPDPSLIKAAVINSGQDMNAANTAAAVPNGNEGWGRMNMKFMLNTDVPMLRLTGPLLDVGQIQTYTGTVSDPSRPVRVSLVWSDPPAVADPALVNNLDLTVTVGTNTYRGNVFASGLSTTGGSADTLNNVENVWLPAGIPAGSPFTIQVRATALNGDGIIGGFDPTDQRFAIVAYNFAEALQFFSIGGRVLNQLGQPINGALVAMRDTSNVTRFARTNIFGFYNFEGVQGGQSYNFSVTAKRYVFNSEASVLVGGNVANLNFTAN